MISKSIIVTNDNLLNLINSSPDLSLPEAHFTNAISLNIQIVSKFLFTFIAIPWLL